MTTRTHKAAEQIVAACHDEDSAKLLKDFEAWFSKARRKHICCILPETVIAEYCCAMYTAKARDKAQIKYVPK